MEKSDTITINKQDLWKYSTFVLAAILIIGAFVFFVNDDTPNVPTNNNLPGQQLPGPSERVEVDLGDAPTRGNEKAKVTVVEFSDYECPFCARHFQQTYPSLVSDYVDTGKILLAFKDFPLNFHPQAQKAAEAARCVGEQMGDEGYWAMHDALFNAQSAGFSVASFKQLARQVGADGSTFDSCLDSGKFANNVKADFAQGQQLGVQGTPSFFVNGNQISGACPYSTFQQAISAELEGKDWYSPDRTCQIVYQ